MAQRQTETLTTQSIDTTSEHYKAVALKVGGNGVGPGIGDQAVRVVAAGNQASWSGVLRFVLTDGVRVYAHQDVAMTGSSVRSDPAGAGGDYVAELDHEFLDLTGHIPAEPNGTPAIGWKMGLPEALVNATSVRVDLFPVKAL